MQHTHLDNRENIKFAYMSTTIHSIEVSVEFAKIQQNLKITFYKSQAAQVFMTWRSLCAQTGLQINYFTLYHVA